MSLREQRGHYYSPASPHSVGHYVGVHPDDQPYWTGEQGDDEDKRDTYNDDALYRQPVTARSQRKWRPLDEDERARVEQQLTRVYPQGVIVVDKRRRRATAQYPYQPAPQVSRELPAPRPTQQLPQQHLGRGPHWLTMVGLVMCLMLALWIGLHSALAWWSVYQDDLHYGRPRTYQIDSVVGHHDSAAHPTHLIALNLNGRIQVIECPAGDCTRSAKVYQGPTILDDGQDPDLVPVTLSIRDVNGDGKPDLIVKVQNSTYVLLNEGGQFRPSTSTDHINL